MCTTSAQPPKTRSENFSRTRNKIDRRRARLCQDSGRGSHAREPAPASRELVTSLYIYTACLTCARALASGSGGRRGEHCASTCGGFCGGFCASTGGGSRLNHQYTMSGVRHFRGHRADNRSFTKIAIGWYIPPPPTPPTSPLLRRRRRNLKPPPLPTPLPPRLFHSNLASTAFSTFVATATAASHAPSLYDHRV